MGIPIFDATIDFFFDNMLFLGALGLAVFYGYQYINLKKKTSVKIIDRTDVERKLFIKRMKFNMSNRFRWLYRGKHNKKLIGKITHYMETLPVSLDDSKAMTTIQNKIDPIEKKIIKVMEQLVKVDLVKNRPHFEELKKEKETLELEKEIHLDKIENIRTRLISMVVQPCLFGGRLTNPLAKPNVIVLQDNGNIQKDEPNIYINETLGIANYVGIYHSIGDRENKVIDNIRETDFRQSDINNLASVYFAKSQEQSTFDPVYAHQMAMEQRKLEIELAKRKGKAESV